MFFPAPIIWSQHEASTRTFKEAGEVNLMFIRKCIPIWPNDKIIEITLFHLKHIYIIL